MSDFTIIRLVPFEGNSPLKAFCDVAVQDLFVIKGVRIVKGRGGEFVSMPRSQTKAGRWYDSIVPLTKRTWFQFSQVVLAAYRSHRHAQPSTPSRENGFGCSSHQPPCRSPEARGCQLKGKASRLVP